MNARLLAVCLALCASNALAQTPSTGTLRVTVVDPSSAIIIGATVTVAGADDETRGLTIAPAQTNDTGVALLSGLKPGRYTVQAEFPGFEARLLKDVRIRTGENKQVAVLPIQKLEASVTVGQDKQQAAADPRGTSFGTTLTREEIEALSDDPATFQQQLQEMAGPGAVIRIDGFEGGALPAKAQIRSIRISRDQFAAEFHNAGGISIEIITQPGLGPIRYFSNFRMRDGGLSGRSPFVPVKGPEQNVNYGFGLGGGLVKDKSSFNLNVFGTSSYETPNLYVALPTGGTRSEALGVRSPRDNMFVNGQVDYALTLDQTLRFAYNLSRFTNNNQGIGGYDQPERAYSTETRTHNFRAQHFGPLGRRGFWRTRVQLFVNDSNTKSATELPTIRVLEAFTSGGAQLSGGEHSTRINIGSDLDYVRGRQSWRAGVLFDAGSYRSDASANYLGTYTYDNLAAYPDHPSNYSRRLGDPNLSFQNVQAGFYIQDDIKPRKNLTLSPGLRYEVQTHVHDAHNLGPRFGATWAPFASGKTTLRGSVGVFYDWLPTGTYEQALRVDGVRQQELNIVNPSDPGNVGIVPPTNRYILGGDYSMPQTTRVSAGIDQQALKVVRVSATYSYQLASRVARGLNLNAPVNGIRPDLVFRNIVEVVSDAASRQHQLQMNAAINPGALLPAFNGPRISWKRTTVFLNYTLARLRNNSDGAFAIPASGDLALEWGPAANDVRNRLDFSLNNQIIRNLAVSFNVNAHTAEAYTLMTGHDANGDGIFNDRPNGVGRNTLRADGQATINMFVSYQFAFGQRTTALPPGIGVFGGGNAATVRTFDQGAARYRLQVFCGLQNLTNTANYFGYSGTMTAPFFGRPTTVREMRKVDIGIGLNF